MAKKSLKPKEEEAAIDMTPMLDIVFIMLIFFIVTTSFVKEAGVDILKPSATTAVKKPKANIFVGITEQGEIYMQKRKVEKDSVRSTIENMLLENPESTVVIQADMRGNSGVLLDVIDAAKKAGVQNISVAAEN
ncbi:ExbD/TolR family protein [Aliikangiella coralliicola]|uniref:Biopolymer transporter ExbD n=1 Tax=Aliikangiella coralliicola TaxID=2592383 RepID=A0A545UAW0_9GAMM|nr:biopolymer transporter ExbD [Aliikangiella coralliicola]TQV86600.1 biopolymer transporter ExbD [Aliikangiella coralliicola]